MNALRKCRLSSDHNCAIDSARNWILFGLCSIATVVGFDALNMATFQLAGNSKWFARRVISHSELVGQTQVDVFDVIDAAESAQFVRLISCLLAVSLRLLAISESSSFEVAKLSTDWLTDISKRFTFSAWSWCASSAGQKWMSMLQSSPSTPERVS